MNNRVIPSVYAAMQSKELSTNIFMNQTEKRNLQHSITKAAYILAKDVRLEKQYFEDKANENLRDLAKQVLLNKNISGKYQKYRATLYNNAGFPTIISGSDWKDVKYNLFKSGIEKNQLPSFAPGYGMNEYTYNKNRLNYKYYIFVSF